MSLQVDSSQWEEERQEGRVTYGSLENANVLARIMMAVPLVIYRTVG